MSNRRTWSDEQLAEAVAENTTYTGTVIALGLYPGNKTCARVRDRIKELKLNTDHFCKSGWKSLTDEELFVRGREFGTTHRRRFLKQVEYLCSRCGISKWLDNLIVLQVDHIDGDTKNNTLANLRLLCPNCHSQTETWCKPKQK